MKKKAKKEELEEQDNTKLETNEALEKIAKNEDNEEFEEFSDVNSNHSFKFIRKTIVIIILLFCVTEPRIVKLAFNPFLLLTVTESRRLFLKDQENYRKNNEKRKIINS